MLYIAHSINVLLMIGFPCLLGVYLTLRFQSGWRLWWIGGATFVLSQVGHIPLNILLTRLFRDEILPTPPESYHLVFNAIILGLSAGLWEEGARYVTYRWWAKDARSWRKSILMGAGHGGIEAIILGILALYTFIQMITFRGANLSTIIPVDQLELAYDQIEAFWSIPWYATFLGSIERIFAITAQITLSVIVLQAFIRNYIRWLWAAIGWHTFIDAFGVYILSTWGAYTVEAFLAIITLINLVIIFVLRKPEPGTYADIELFPLHKPATIANLPEIEVTPESIEQTRYN